MTNRSLFKTFWSIALILLVISLSFAEGEKAPLTDTAPPIQKDSQQNNPKKADPDCAPSAPLSSQGPIRDYPQTLTPPASMLQEENPGGG